MKNELATAALVCAAVAAHAAQQARDAALRAFEAKARAADARPPELRTENLERYSTNALNFVLNKLTKGEFTI